MAMETGCGEASIRRSAFGRERGSWPASVRRAGRSTWSRINGRFTFSSRCTRPAGPVRFRKLQRAVEPITQKELTKRLRELERAGWCDRRVFAEVPPRVEYRLTELGSSLDARLDRPARLGRAARCRSSSENRAASGSRQIGANLKRDRDSAACARKAKCMMPAISRD